MLFEQGVAAGQHHAVERKQRHQFHRHVFLVDADADRPARALRLQRDHRRQRFVQRLSQHRRMALAVGQAADVVQQQHIDVIGAEPLQAALEGTQHAVAAVVELGAAPGHGEAVPPRRGRGIVVDAAADLGRERVAGARQPTQALPQALLAQPVAVVRRGVEMADAGGIGIGHRGQRHRIVHLGVQIADRRGAEAQGGQLHTTAAQRARRQGGVGGDSSQRHARTPGTTATADRPRTREGRKWLGSRMARLCPGSGAMKEGRSMHAQDGDGTATVRI
ncbi:hypothetical protein NB706_003447 [Xanthomonas sacchari]|nr:hypothetical protein [Xanthomonas sacchari]